MLPLTWTASHAVWLTEIDDQHREIFEALAYLQKILTDACPPATVRKATQDLYSSAKEHFAHEERPMRAARYGSLQWHRQQHNAARKRLRKLLSDLDQGDSQAGVALVEYFSSWLSDHTRLADRMMCAFLRNEQRGICKVAFRVGTKPAAACSWVDAQGDKFDPLKTPTDL